MDYRPDIDGLRAVAVVSVILFHAEVDGFAGGFVGVDVFFVISGFLITSILASQLENGSFSFLDFYRRRARRLIPALLTMLVGVSIAAAVVYPRARFVEILDDVFHATVFTANIHFWQQAGYFEVDSLTAPLLHTWSLSVEEQFYFVLPILMVVLHRISGRAMVVALATLSAASFVLTLWTARSAPDAGFFLPFTRAWELFAGSLAALATRRFGSRSNDVLSLTGLALVLLSVLLFDETTPFPSHLTLIPVVGTFLLLLFGSGSTFSARLLGRRPIVAIGLVSYSAYLWHQPLFAMARVQTVNGRISPTLTTALIVGTFAMAWLSWRFVEQPFRHRPAVVHRPGRTVALAACGLAVVGLSSQVTAIGLRATEAPDLEEQEAGILRWSGSEAVERIGLGETLGKVRLIEPASDAEPCRVLAFGDSHTEHLATGFGNRLVDATGCDFELWTFSGCPSLIGWYKVYDIDEQSEPERQATCRLLIQEWENHLARRGNDYDLVIMSSRWNWLVGPERYGDGRTIRRDAVLPVEEDPSSGLDLDVGTRIDHLGDALRSTVGAIRRHGPTVVLVSQPPVQRFDLRNLEVGPDFEAAAPSRSDAAARHDLWTAAVESSGIRSYDGVVYLDLFDALYCPGTADRCRNTLDGQALYHDSNHLSAFGAARVAELMLERLEATDTVVGRLGR